LALFEKNVFGNIIPDFGERVFYFSRGLGGGGVGPNPIPVFARLVPWCQEFMYHEKINIKKIKV